METTAEFHTNAFDSAEEDEDNNRKVSGSFVTDVADHSNKPVKKPMNQFQQDGSNCEINSYIDTSITPITTASQTRRTRAGLDSLPNEILLSIGTYLDLFPTHSLCLTNRRLNHLLTSRLYSRGAYIVSHEFYDPYANPAYLSICRHNILAISRFLEAGLDPNTCVKINHPPSTPEDEPDSDDSWPELAYREEEYTTPSLLHLAVESSHARDDGDLSIIRLLLNYSANVNSKGEELNTDTPLILVAKNQDNDHDATPEILGLLLENGADITAHDDEGNTALHLVTPYGFWGSIEVLVKAGADLNHKNEEGQTPLDLIGNVGWEETERKLIEWGADEWRGNNPERRVISRHGK
jgi:hypothetical protein